MGSAICGSKASTATELSIQSARFTSILPENQNPTIFFDGNDSLSDSVNLIEISIKCLNLLTENRFALLNPVVHIFLECNSEYIKKAETEIIMKTLNPMFTTKIKFPYSLRCNQKLKFEILDFQFQTKTKELIGSIVTSIHEIVKPGFITKDIMKKGKKEGTITITSTELTYLNDTVKMHWKLLTQKKYGNCILRILREEDKQKFTVHQTESQNFPYKWEEIEITINKLCKGEETKKALYEIVSIGESEFVVFSERLSLKEIKAIEANPEHSSDGEEQRLVLLDLKIVNEPSFINYIQSGLNLTAVYGIDFSTGFGHDNEESSSYLKLINGIHKILQFYSSESSLFVFGVGGTFIDSLETSDFFAVNGNIFRPNIFKASMLAECYKTTLSSIVPSNNTNFSQFFKTLYSQFTYESLDPSSYQVIIFICGQDVSDSLLFKESVTKFEHLPVSILILSINPSVNNNSQISHTVNEIQINSSRQFLSFDLAPNTFTALENIQSQVLQYSKLKSIPSKPKQVYKSNRSQTVSLLSQKEKLKSSSSYYTKCKEITLQKLKDLGYETEKIFEVELKGLPYFVHDSGVRDNIPSLSFKTSSRFNRQKSLKAVCISCRRVVIKFSQVHCGCINVCESCVGSYICEKTIH